MRKIPLTLGTDPVGKLLKKYSLPAIVAMTASSLYNMVDSIFIGHGVGALAISGLAITFPFMNLAAAFGALVGVGASTLVSVKLGEKDYDTAQRVLGNVVILNLIMGLSFTVIALIFLNPVLYFFGASANTIQYAHDYMVVILLGNVITHVYFGLNAVLRSSGHPKEAMLTTILAVVLNSILDPIFIFVFHWGIRGAAIATVLAQVAGLVWLIYQFTRPEELLHFHRGIFFLKKKIVKESIAIGLAPFFMNVAGSFVVILINNGLKNNGGDLAIGAFGIINRISFLFLMIVMGLNQGMQPIAGYNYGARQMSRVMEVLKQTTIIATLITSLGFIAGEFFPHVLSNIFTTDKQLINLTEYGMRIVMASFPIVGMQIVISNFFQSIGMANKAIVLSLLRQVFCLIPFLVIFPRIWGITGVWISMPAADVISLIISLSLISQQIKKWRKTGLLS